jgi:3-hydroxymyristoyl/3-hydroxydecanoyl-(acyl carrier protein) dehydratase
MIRKKSERHEKLMELLITEPFITDEDIAKKLGISVQTIRLDRLELGIPELRERMKTLAENNYKKIKTVLGREFIGELIDLVPGKSGISMLDTSENMAFEKTKVVKGQHIYAMAETLALAIVDAKAALTAVANIKYKKSVLPNDRLIAKGQVIRNRGNKLFVWVFIYVNYEEVFRGKFVLVAIDESKGE